MADTALNIKHIRKVEILNIAEYDKDGLKSMPYSIRSKLIIGIKEGKEGVNYLRDLGKCFINDKKLRLVSKSTSLYKDWLSWELIGEDAQTLWGLIHKYLMG